MDIFGVKVRTIYNVGFIGQSLSQYRYVDIQLLYVVPAGAPISAAESNGSSFPFWCRRSIRRSVGVPNSVFFCLFLGKIRRKRSVRLPSGRPTLKCSTNVVVRNATRVYLKEYYVRVFMWIVSKCLPSIFGTRARTLLVPTKYMRDPTNPGRSCCQSDVFWYYDSRSCTSGTSAKLGIFFSSQACTLRTWSMSWSINAYLTYLKPNFPYSSLINNNILQYTERCLENRLQ
jgi:hypothetical protein